MMGPIRKLAGVVGALAIVGLVAGPAWAPKVFRRQVITDATCTTTTSSGTFAGRIEVSHFTSSGDAISASGVLDGNCETPSGRVDVAQGQSVSLPPTVSLHSCTQGFAFDYTGTLGLPNMSVTMSLDLLVEVPDDAARARRLCAAVVRYDEGHTEAAVRILNSLLAAEAREDTRQLEPK